MGCVSGAAGSHLRSQPSALCPAVSCRSAALCVRMNNVTMVIPTEREVNYHIFMYTMYNSPAPSLHQLAAFMRTDLGFKQLEVSVAGLRTPMLTLGRKSQTVEIRSCEEASPAPSSVSITVGLL